jgi:hypothetical protein
MRTFQSVDGIVWAIEVLVPASSNAMVVFRHPSGRSTRLDRYNWYLSRDSASHRVTSQLTASKVLESLTNSDLGRLLHRSMPITTTRPSVNLASGLGGSSP